MEEEQEIKQTYLRKEILEKNYDANLFLEFLITKKGEIASDINNWTIEELKTVVSEFKNTQNEVKKENISPNSTLEDLPPADNQILKINSFTTPLCSKDSNKSQNNENDDIHNSLYNENGNKDWLFVNKEENERFSRYSISNYNNNNYLNPEEIDCLEPDHSPFEKIDKIKIIVGPPKKEYESTGLKGFFIKSIYYSFLLENIPNKKQKIKRRYTDFEWLRKTLYRLFPGNYIPPLPLKTLNINKPEKVDKYQKYLQYFVDSIMDDKLFKNSSIIYLFFTTENERDLISLMEKYNKVEKPKCLSYFYSREGNMVLDENILKRDKKKELLDIKSDISKNSKILGELNAKLKLLGQEMKQVCDRMTEISNIFKKLYETSINNSEKLNYCKYYSDLSLYFKEYGNHEFLQMKNISEELKFHLKYINLHYTVSIEELYNTFKFQHDLYFQVAENLKQKKEILYKNMEYEKWELNPEDRNINISDKKLVLKKMLPNDTRIVNDIKKYLIYYATQLNKENIRLKDVLEKNNNNNFKKLKDKSKKILNEFNGFLGLINSKHDIN
jgi:hypothetical protein